MPRRLATAFPAFTPARALRASLLLVWLNYLATARWASQPGSLHGGKQWFFMAALVVATGLALVFRAGSPVDLGRESRVALVAGVLFLAGTFLCWFPPSTWSQIPFHDDWAPRYQSTVDQAARFLRGAGGGWQWSFLGGYHVSSDFTQSLGALAVIPIALFGDRAGFHVLHLLMFLAVPALVYADLSLDRRRDRAASDEVGTIARLAAAIACVVTAGYSFSFIKSGDTNAMGGVLGLAGALVGSHAARAGRSWGPIVLVLALVAAAYSHFAFLMYAALYLLLDAACARDLASARRAAIALGAAFVASLPLTWESWRYPSYFTFNNVSLEDAPPIALASTLRQFYYNVEILFLPGRWFNDYGGLTAVFTPVYLFVLLKGEGRARFHAAAALMTTLLVRFNVPQFGFAFIRPLYLYPIFAGPVLAWFVVRHSTRRTVAIALVALVALYVDIAFLRVPHVESLRAFNPGLVDRIAALDGHLVLIENSFHPNMSADPRIRTQPTPFTAHFEALLPDATGRAFFAGMWDGWQWCPARRNLLANGSLGGRPIDTVPIEDLVRVLRRWGVRHLLVWSDRSTQALSRAPAFRLLWTQPPWRHFELIDADTRSAVAPGGTASLRRAGPLAGEVDLAGIAAGDTIVVRTNFHPSWDVLDGTERLSTFEQEGQLAFRAARPGSYTVALVYPRRPQLLAAAAAAVIIGIIAAGRVRVS